MLHKKQKALTQTHKKAKPNTTHQASPPHEKRKGRAALPRGPFAFRGAWGDWSPHKTKNISSALMRRQALSSSNGGSDVP